MMAGLTPNLYIGLLSILLCACQPNTSLGNEEKKMSINEVYQLGFGLEGEQQFIKYAQQGEDRQPAGMGFLNLLWSPPNLATVNINLGPHSLSIPNTISVLGTKINYDKSMQGVQIFDLNAALNKEEYVTEEQAYNAYRVLIKQLESKGWKQYFIPFSARFHKKDNLKLILESGKVADPFDILSFKDWNEVFNNEPSIVIRLYLPDYILSITLSKTGHLRDQVQYMLRFSFESVKYNRRNLISKAYKMSETELEEAYLANVKRHAMLRKMEETELKAKGYHIDESYQDPEVWEYVK